MGRGHSREVFLAGAALMTHRWLAICGSFLLCLSLVISVASDASAHSYKLGSISIGHVWAPPPAEGADGLPVYGALLNQGANTVKLVGAETPIAEDVRFRLKDGGNDIWPDGISLVPNKPFGLAEWREHIWISGLKKQLKAGDTFELTLDFGEKGKVATTVIVEDEAGH